MEQFQTVLDTITAVIEAFKAFFENLLAMFKKEEGEAEDETTAA